MKAPFTAARSAPVAEVEGLVKRLRERPSFVAWETGEQTAARRQEDREQAADALTSLSAMLAECERERKRWEYLADCAWKQGDVDAWARLCDAQNWPRIDTVNEMKQVVDERDAAEARVEALEKALKPFADIAQSIEEHCYDIDDNDETSVATRDLFAARAALNKGEG
jgi:hypothetical protein